jgi:hypothetical protein
MAIASAVSFTSVFIRPKLGAQPQRLLHET